MAAQLDRGDESDKPPAPSGPASAWHPFRHKAFAVIWTATVISNIGAWMHSTAAGWLITSLNSDPLIVSLVQVAAALPLFLFAIPAGALADIMDRRRLLLVIETGVTLITVVFAAVVWLGWITPTLVLLFTFVISTGGALAAPAWQAVTPQLVPRADLQPALALNSVGFNVSRAIGPALGGLIIATIGIAAPFFLDAMTNLAVLAALLWWRLAPRAQTQLPAERLGQAVEAGLRYARYNPDLRSTLARAVGFFLFASAYWALLPLIARQQVAGGPALFGLLLGAIGTGAVGGAFLLPRARRRLGPDRLVQAGTAGTAVAMVLFAIARTPPLALLASLVAGASWIAVLSSLNYAAQVALPEWVRGRGLALFVTVYFGAHTLGSVIWGEVAALAGLPIAHLLAAAGAVLAIPFMRRWKLQPGAGVDLTPSMHWPEPVLAQEIEADRGPVLVTVEYRIDPDYRERFLEALYQLAPQRRRDGAYRWGVFEDVAEPGRFVETFLVESWIEHLRQHERVTHADRALQDCVGRFNAKGEPKITHFIAPALHPEQGGTLQP
jgi:predicted MFS family arabinose efflux permease/quinol monooxygenase YgiN